MLTRPDLTLSFSLLEKLRMDATLHALGILLIEAIPTILFFIVLTFYLNAVLFKPMARIFEERRQATEGVRELAQRAFEAADNKASEFERALAAARAELYQEHEALRRQWIEEQHRQIAAARAEAERQIDEAKAQIAQEVGRAQADLSSSIGPLSDRIIASLTRKRAA